MAARAPPPCLPPLGKVDSAKNACIVLPKTNEVPAPPRIVSFYLYSLNTSLSARPMKSSTDITRL